MMKKLWILALPMLLGLVSCSGDNSDNPASSQITEQDLVGLWYEEYEYADVTETGVPFSRVLMVVITDADHTGCLYLGAFGPEGYDPLAIYGGPEEAGFTWQLCPDGSVVLTDPASGESIALSRRATDDNSYGDDMTDVSNTSLTYTSGSLTLTNDSYSGTLEKADAEKEAEIKKVLEGIVTKVNSGDTGIGIGGISDGPARARRHGGID